MSHLTAPLCEEMLGRGVNEQTVQIMMIKRVVFECVQCSGKVLHGFTAVFCVMDA